MRLIKNSEYCGLVPHLTNDKGEVLYASLLRVKVGNHTVVQQRNAWVNVHNLNDAYFAGLWADIVSEHQSDPDYQNHEIVYYPISPDPNETLIIVERGGEKK